MTEAMPTGSEIREMFLRYFEQQGHTRVHSSSLVPANDPTLLFTNAGMNQFKDVFLGLEKRSYSRACSSQKCVRAGGKHNDLENVGFTNRHHTFFEMLGNFSFGDYFKQDAIQFAWELLTSPKWYGIPKDKLYCTIFKGEGGVGRDDEAEKYWLGVGVPKDRIHALGMKDNFWQMGDTGPCGPCSEVHYDMGPQASDLGHKDCAFGCDCGRYVELWNLVFMQFDRQFKTIEERTGGSEAKLALQSVKETVLNPLPKPCVDTGMGLERVAAVLQDKISNYNTDLFQALIERAGELVGIEAKPIYKFVVGGPSSFPTEQEKRAIDLQQLMRNPSLRIIADHSRAATFLISDGVLPSNEGRGYVLRKILRRGIRHGQLLGQEEPFMFKMVSAVRDLMKDAYPELIESAERVAGVIEAEGHQFARVISEGARRFEGAVAELITGYVTGHQHQDVLRQDAARRGGNYEGLVELLRSSNPAKANAYFIESLRGLLGSSFSLTFPGDKAFRIYETYGLPLDFMIDATHDLGIAFDQSGFDKAIESERERARASWKGVPKLKVTKVYETLPHPGTEFEGYRQTESRGCMVRGIFRNGQSALELRPGEEGEVFLDRTPFYAEAGGQVGDVGWLYDYEHTHVIADVKGCYSPIQGERAHILLARDFVRKSDLVDAVVDGGARLAVTRNHTATHLLHAALREILGKHVKQAGSLVATDHLRFDFSHFTRVGDEELQNITHLANKEAMKDHLIEVINDVPIDVAVNEYKAMALFGEKYGDKVRVIKIGDFSTELCGGTHTGATGEIGPIQLLEEASVSAGVRRITAITGMAAVHHSHVDHRLEQAVRRSISRTRERIDEETGYYSKLTQPLDYAFVQHLNEKDEEIKKLRKELDRARMKSASASVAASGDQVRVVSGVKVLAQRVESLDRSQMRTLVDNLRQKLGSGVVVLGSAADGKVSLIVGVTKDLAERVPAGKIIGPVAKMVGGSGGGRPDLAEAGGKDPEALDAALAEACSVVESLLK
jgi:alanyl-tRNA synthetase